jgi:hypothetical protein
MDLGTEIIENRNTDALPEEGCRQSRSDETSATGDQYILSQVILPWGER